MSAQAPAVKSVAAAANNLLLKKLGVVALAMFGFGFALVPFYEKICEVTGIRNLFQADEVVVKNTQVDTTRSVTIEFDSNVQRLAWTFKPVDRAVKLNLGETKTVFFRATNTSDQAATGTAVFNVTVTPGRSNPATCGSPASSAC